MGKHTTHLEQKGAVRVQFGPKLTVSKRNGSKVQYNLVSVSELKDSSPGLHIKIIYIYTWVCVNVYITQIKNTLK